VSPITSAAIAFALILASTLIGMFLRYKLPEHHLSGDSKDVIKLATALVGTMSALVLALLFASTRNSFEHTSAAVSRMTAAVVELDQFLEEYGPQAQPIRAALRREIGPLIDSFWREDAEARGVKPPPPGYNETVHYMLRELQPSNPVQVSIQARALQVINDFAQTRLSLVAQPSDSISQTFIIVLVIWLMFIFAVFSMSSPPNATLGIVLFLCIVSASAAIYLILELGQPFDGLMQISNEALRTALR
jgi:ABC-type multidrug transport system fused ATPase/permease subunit